MNQQTYLSVVITQYNELKNLENGALDRLIEYMQKQPYTWEIIVNDDGSVDGSREYTEKYTKFENFHYIKGEHKGKAGGLWNAIQEAQGEWTILTDIDQSTPMNQIEKLLPYVATNDVIIGSRGVKRDNTSAIRQLASFGFRTVRKILLLYHIEDTQCGFKLFKTEKLKKFFPHLEVVSTFAAQGWNVTAFDVELLFMFEKTGSTIKEVEVEWKNEDISDSKDRKFFKESADMAKQIFNVFRNNIKRKYDHLLS